MGRGHRWFWFHKELAQLDPVTTGPRPTRKWIFPRLFVSIELLVHQV